MIARGVVETQRRSFSSRGVPVRVDEHIAVSQRAGPERTLCNTTVYQEQSDVLIVLAFADYSVLGHVLLLLFTFYKALGQLDLFSDSREYGVAREALFREPGDTTYDVEGSLSVSYVRRYHGERLTAL